jgi:hypothetical protein
MLTRVLSTVHMAHKRKCSKPVPSLIVTVWPKDCYCLKLRCCRMVKRLLLPQATVAAGFFWL